MSIDYENQNDQQTREISAEREAHYFLGKKLHPYSFGRRALVDRMLFQGQSPTEFFSTIVFVCMKSIDECDSIRSEEERKLFRKQRDDWADATGAGFDEAVMQVGGQILDEWQTAKHDAQPKKDQVSKDAAPGN